MGSGTWRQNLKRETGEREFRYGWDLVLPEPIICAQELCALWEGEPCLIPCSHDLHAALGGLSCMRPGDQNS